MNFPCPITLKSIVYLVLRTQLLPMYDFVISYFGHLKNIISLNYTDFPNIDTSYYTHTLVNITVDLIRALFKWEAVIMADTNFLQY